MKRFITILIVACVVAGSLFAAQGDIRVGGHLGYGFDITSAKQQLLGGQIIDKMTSDGFHFAVSGEYEFVEGISAKLEAGGMTMGCLKEFHKTNEGEETEIAEKATPINVNVYLGVTYEIPINDMFGAFAGLGVDAMIGKQSADADEQTNARIGVGLDAGGTYNLNDQISFNGGARYCLYFLNTSDQAKEAIEYLKAHNGKIFQHGMKVFAGVSYSL